MATIQQFSNAIVCNTGTLVTISSGQTESDIFACQAVAPGALVFPSNWTPCNIGFFVSSDQEHEGFLADTTGTALSIATNTNQFLPLLPINFHCVSFIKIICSVPQASDVMVQFVLSPYHQGIHA